MLSGQIFQFSECQCPLIRYIVLKKKNTLGLRLTMGSSNLHFCETDYFIDYFTLFTDLHLYVGSLEGIPQD